ncbi:MAG: ECF transporter S component [Clostridia bacterium]|nr:ECF transporter S component [Clostridia bacterium]
MSVKNLSARKGNKNYVYRTVVMALFCALAYATMFVFRFNVTFLTFDLKDVFLTIGGLLFGPVAAVVMSLLVALLEFITVGDTGFYGFLMNFVSSAVFTSVCALVYQYRKKLRGAIIGLVAAVIIMTGVMMVMNLLVTPLYTSSTSADVAKMIPTLLLPFNLTKAVFNAAFVLLLYKPVSRALKAAGFTPSPGRLSEDTAEKPAEDAAARKSANLKNTLFALSIGVVLLAAAIFAFVFILHGEMEWLHNPFADLITK